MKVRKGDAVYLAKHKNSGCVDFMRRTLLEDLGDVYWKSFEQPDFFARWKRAAADAGAEKPRGDLGQERWVSAVSDQLENASRAQVAAYYADRYDTCPICGLGEE